METSLCCSIKRIEFAIDTGSTVDRPVETIHLAFHSERIPMILKILKWTEKLPGEPGSEIFRLLQHVSVFASLTQSKIQSSNVIGHGYLKHVKSRQITRYILLFYNNTNKL